MSPVAAGQTIQSAHVNDLGSGKVWFGQAAGTANTYTLAQTGDPVPAAYVAGMMAHFTVPATNTGASTLNVNGLGARPIRVGTAELTAGTLVADGSMYAVVCDASTNFQLVSSVQAGALTNAFASWEARDTGITPTWADTDDATASASGADKFRIQNGSATRVKHDVTNKAFKVDLDINALSVATPEGTADYGVFLDATDSLPKKALLNDFPSGTAASLAHCVLTLTSDKSISTTPTTLPWDAASPNVGSMWSAGTPGDVVIPVTGYYTLGFQLVTGVVSQVGALINVNGARKCQALSYENNQFGNSVVIGLWEGTLTANDVVTFLTYANGTSPQAKDTEEGGTRAWVRRIY